MIDVSMLESMLSLLLGEVQTSQFPVPPAGRPMFGPVRTADGFIMPAVASERTFQGLARAAGHPEWISDARYALYNDRRRHWGELIDELELWSGSLTTAECQAAFDREGVPSSPYRSVREVLADPQLAHREALAEVQDAAGSFHVVNPPFRMSAATAKVAGFAAALGEHTRDVLRQAGYSDVQIEAFAASGTINNLFRVAGEVGRDSVEGEGDRAASLPNVSIEQGRKAPLHGVGDVERQRLDRAGRVHAGRGDEDAAVDDEQVLHVVAAAPFVDHRALGIGAHARGAHQVPAAIGDRRFDADVVAHRRRAGSRWHVPRA